MLMYGENLFPFLKEVWFGNINASTPPLKRTFFGKTIIPVSPGSLMMIVGAAYWVANLRYVPTASFWLQLVSTCVLVFIGLAVFYNSMLVGIERRKPEETKEARELRYAREAEIFRAKKALGPTSWEKFCMTLKTLKGQVCPQVEFATETVETKE